VSRVQLFFEKRAAIFATKSKGTNELTSPPMLAI
jgi:hypothetical protein